MRKVEGVVILAQESRFQLSDDGGVAHLFLLSHAASAEPSDLVGLQRSGIRVRVSFGEAPRLLARVAHRIELCDSSSPTQAS